MSKYVLVEWPEIQNYMEHPRYSECYSGNSINETETAGVWFVPEDLYEEVEYKLQFPKVYENTSIGTVTCMENYAIVKSTEEYFWYGKELKKGCKVLVYLNDAKDFVITACKAYSPGLPILLENNSLLPGLNCEIIGVSNDNL